jgi:hypothetical protein
MNRPIETETPRADAHKGMARTWVCKRTALMHGKQTCTQDLLKDENCFCTNRYRIRFHVKARSYPKKIEATERRAHVRPRQAMICNAAMAGARPDRATGVVTSGCTAAASDGWLDNVWMLHVSVHVGEWV